LASECNESKEKYDNCFIKWYSEKFLPGTAKEDDCGQLFQTYNKCLWNALKERKIDQMVQDARNEAKETDAEHMSAPVIKRA